MLGSQEREEGYREEGREREHKKYVLETNRLWGQNG